MTQCSYISFFRDNKCADRFCYHHSCRFTLVYATAPNKRFCHAFQKKYTLYILKTRRKTLMFPTIMNRFSQPGINFTSAHQSNSNTNKSLTAPRFSAHRDDKFERRYPGYKQASKPVQRALRRKPSGEMALPRLFDSQATYLRVNGLEQVAKDKISNHETQGIYQYQMSPNNKETQLLQQKVNERIQAWEDFKAQIIPAQELVRAISKIDKNTHDRSGQTEIFRAINHRDTEQVKQLLEDPDVDLTVVDGNLDETPLMRALYTDRHMRQLFLEALSRRQDFNINHKSSELGRTALSIAENLVVDRFDNLPYVITTLQKYGATRR
jgi:hypothetical protein